VRHLPAQGAARRRCRVPHPTTVSADRRRSALLHRRTQVRQPTALADGVFPSARIDVAPLPGDRRRAGAVAPASSIFPGVDR